MKPLTLQRPHRCGRYPTHSARSTSAAVARLRPVRGREGSVRLPSRDLAETRTSKNVVPRFVCASTTTQAAPHLKPNKEQALWTVLDAMATLGSIAGAAALLTTTQTLFVGFPLILPLVAWYAGRQKERLKVEVSSVHVVFSCTFAKLLHMTSTHADIILHHNPNSLVAFPPANNPVTLSRIEGLLLTLADCYTAGSSAVVWSEHQPK